MADRRYALLRRNRSWGIPPDYYIMADPDRDVALLKFVRDVLGYDIFEVKEGDDGPRENT